MRADYPDYKKIVFSYMRVLGAYTLALIAVGAVLAVLHVPDWVVLTAFGAVACLTGIGMLVMGRVWGREQRQRRVQPRGHEPKQPARVPPGRAAYLLVSFLLQVFGFLGLLALLAGLIARIPALAISGGVLFGLLLLDISIVSPLARARRANKR